VIVNRIPDRRTRFILLLLTLSLDAGYAQSVDEGYEIATWKDFRDAAITHTFDDGTPNQLPVALPIFDQYDFKVTLFTVTSWGPNWSGLAAASADGHEVASHTVTHPYLNNLTADGQTDELQNSHDAILANIPNAGPLTLAYPYCVRGDDAITKQYYFAARGCSGSIEPSTPSDMLDISSIIIGTEGSVQTGADLIKLANDAAEVGGWAVLLMHGVDNDGGYSPVKSSALKPFVQYLAAADENFWVETFGNVVRYIQERDGASVTELSAGGDSIVVTISDQLDDDVFDYPITVSRVLPEDWVSASVTQAGGRVASRLVEGDGGSFVMFDVIPDAGDIVLTKRTTTSTSGDEPERPDQGRMIETYPNPANRRATLAYRVAEAGHVRIEMFDLLGRKVDTIVDAVKTVGRFETLLDAAGYAPGAYLYRMETGSQLDTGLLILQR
jgi:peptidoglycan/xylan/chitin deacetylase (PgdA/CDA1 family)